MSISISELSKIKRFYILGIGRSGTTLLVNTLNRHRNISATPESVFAQFFYASYRQKTSYTKNDIDAILDFIKTNEKLFPFIDWDFDYTFFSTIEYPLQINYDSLLNLIHLQFIPPEGRKKEIHYIIDKNPGNSLFGSDLLEINSSSKAIILVRDYRAYLLSLKEKKYWRSTSTVYNARRWQLFYIKLLKLNQQYPEKTLFIRYEDVVSNNEVVIKKIFDILDIPFSKEILTPTASTLTEEELKEKYN
ncbi:MAG: sulfotransferase, partial [Flavobacteriales bacterium]|nr:sulfotransferase [Flavobacteriales bacterium]